MDLLTGADSCLWRQQEKVELHVCTCIFHVYMYMYMYMYVQYMYFVYEYTHIKTQVVNYLATRGQKPPQSTGLYYTYMYLLT